MTEHEHYEFNGKIIETELMELSNELDFLFRQITGKDPDLGDRLKGLRDRVDRIEEDYKEKHGSTFQQEKRKAEQQGKPRDSQGEGEQ